MDMKFSNAKIDFYLFAIGGLIFLSALTKIRLLLGIQNYQQFWVQAFIIVFFGSAGLSLVGLFWRKTWGFLFVYVYIFMATFFFSISVIPFLFGLLNMHVKAATILLIIVNLGVLIFTAFLHVAKSKENKVIKEES